MGKRGVKLFILIFVLVLIVSLSFVTAGFFSDLWSKITGKPVTIAPSPSQIKSIDDTGSSGIAAITSSASCYDSDGGLNYDVKGSVSGTNANGTFYNYTDYCSSSINLREYYCSGGLPYMASYSCEYGCSDGACLSEPVNQTHKVCSGSLCITVSGAGSDECSTDEQCTINQTTQTCSDSDGGINYNVFGTVNVNYGNGSVVTGSDWCYSNNVLREAYCDSSVDLAWINYGCPGQCALGECVSNYTNQTCTSDADCLSTSVYDNSTGCTTTTYYVCQGGECVSSYVGVGCPSGNETNQTCYTDDDCPPVTTRYCDGNIAVTNTNYFSCIDGNCTSVGGTGSAMPCEYGCENGFCLTSSSMCGDVDDSGQVNIVDLTYLVDYIWKGGPAPVSMISANVDGFNGINVADVTYFVSYLFHNGTDLNCAFINTTTTLAGGGATGGVNYGQVNSFIDKAEKDYKKRTQPSLLQRILNFFGI